MLTFNSYNEAGMSAIPSDLLVQDGLVNHSYANFLPQQFLHPCFLMKPDIDFNFTHISFMYSQLKFLKKKKKRKKEKVKERRKNPIFLSKDK